MFRTLTVFLHGDERSFATAEFLTYEAANLWRQKIVIIKNYNKKFPPLCLSYQQEPWLRLPCLPHPDGIIQLLLDP